MKLQPVTPHTFIPFTCFSLSSDANHRAPLARYDKIESVPVFGTDSRQLVGVHAILRVNWICVEVIARWIFGAGENLKSEYIFIVGSKAVNSEFSGMVMSFRPTASFAPQQCVRRYDVSPLRVG